MDHSVLTILDLGIITAYLVIMVLVGVYSVRRIQNTKDYYVAGRSFGPMVLMATVCATIIGGSGLMGRAGVAYTDGFKAVLTAIPYLLGMFIFSGIAGKISDIGMQYGITSIPELFERRFGRAAKITLSVLIAFAMMGTVASQVTATATIIRMLGGEFGLSYEMGALIATVAMAFSSASSVGTLPLNLECTERLGARRDIASFVLPLGATINMDGTAIYQGVCAVFIATCYGVDLTLGQMITIVLTATLASIGTAGVPGSGVVMLTMVLESVNLPVAGIGLVIGVDRIFDMGRTTVNITGDAACALVVSNLEKKAEARRAARRPRA